MPPFARNAYAADGYARKKGVAALKKSKTFNGLTFMEMILDRTDCNKALLGWGTAVADYNEGKGKAAD